MGDGAVISERVGVQVIDLRDDFGCPGLGAAAAARPSKAGTPRRRWAWTAIRGVREVLLIAAVYSLYDLTRFLVAGDHDGALSHGRYLLGLEQRWGVAPEHALNTLFSAHISLALPSDYIYATLHYIVTPIVLIWLWRRHGPAYSRARSTLMLATIIGLIGFSLLPVAPPRMLPHFVDTMAKFSHYGWWGTDASAPRGFGGDTNEFAAFPSLHVGWALWCGWQLVKYGRHWLTRTAGAAYPIVVGIVVVATANHYLLDVVAGVAVLALAAAVVRGMSALALRLWPRTHSCSPSSSSQLAPG